MLESDKGNFHELMIGAGELYSKEITKPLLRIYFNALADYSIEKVTDAFSRHIGSEDRASSFFPKPGDLIRMMRANSETVEHRAELAWLEIENAIRHQGAYRSVKLEDKQAMAALKSLGSWFDLCMTDIDKMQWKKRDFMVAYTTFENTPTEILPSSLPGIAELKNQRNELGAGLLSIKHGLEDFKKRNGNGQ